MRSTSPAANSKSRTAKLARACSDFDVAGIAATPCFSTSHRSATWAAIAVRGADFGQHRIVGNLSLDQRHAGRQRHAEPVHGLAQPVLPQVDVELDLVGDDAVVADDAARLLEVADSEVEHADVAHAAVFLLAHQRFQRRPHADQPEVRPVQQHQVHVVGAQPLEALGHRVAQFARLEAVQPHLGGQKRFGAVHAGRIQRPTDGVLVAVDLGGVDVPVADLQRLRHHAQRGVVVELERAEADRRHRQEGMVDQRCNAHGWRRLGVGDGTARWAGGSGCAAAGTTQAAPVRAL